MDKLMSNLLAPDICFRASCVRQVEVPYENPPLEPEKRALSAVIIDAKGLFRESCIKLLELKYHGRFTA
jgi:hypothetical protein